MLSNFDKQQAARILACYGISDIAKSESQDNDIEKGGEGSKGGRVIGHTRSGKPVYEDHRADSKHYKDFSKQDHHDASELHEDILGYYHATGGATNLAIKHQRKSQNHEAKRDQMEGEHSTSDDATWSKMKEGQHDDFKKGQSNDIEKSEGSRGGKVIGHTKSGKAIYDHHDHAGHKGFTSRDHEDAANLHFQSVDHNNNSQSQIDAHIHAGDQHEYAANVVRGAEKMPDYHRPTPDNGDDDRHGDDPSSKQYGDRVVRTK